MEGRHSSLTSLSQIMEKRKKDSSVSKQLQKFNKIKAIFSDVQNRAGKRKTDCITAFQKYVSNFEMWLQGTLRRLQSGEIVTTDILQFEEDLMVIIFSFNNTCTRMISFSYLCKYFRLAYFNILFCISLLLIFGYERQLLNV